jgi:1,4-dihydroxy-2-naphthoate octaprenyltransferase
MTDNFSTLPNRITPWLLASRPRTLPAAAAPVILGAALAQYDRVFRLDIFLAALLAALLLQIAANLANDVFDYLRGADTTSRQGPLRVTQAGLLSTRQVMTGLWLTIGLAALLGVYLSIQAGWPILVIGVLAIIAGLAYTGGPLPYGYYGLGDVFVFLFFGLAAVCGTYYAQAGSLTLPVVFAAVPMGFLSTAILVVNNLRDIETDRQAGKNTLPVRFGIRFARLEYLVLVLLAFITPPVMAFTGLLTPWVVLAMLSAVKLPALFRLIFQQTGRPLNHALAGTGSLELWYALLFSLGLLLGRA